MPMRVRRDARRLFKGYDAIVVGDLSRRRAETLFLDDVRGWIDTLAAKAVAIVDAAEGKSRV